LNFSGIFFDLNALIFRNIGINQEESYIFNTSTSDIFNLKQIIIYLLLVLFSIKSFEVVIITLQFKLNQDFFIEICENKDKPEMHCNGKCHLKKQIQEHEKKESENEKTLKDKDPSLFLSATLRSAPIPFYSKQNYQNRFSNIIYCRLPYFDIFHPPRNILL